jgi:hypothetical protein
MTDFISSLSGSQNVELLFVGYYGRAAAYAGYQYWQSEYATDVNAGWATDTIMQKLASEFTPQAETLALYPFLANNFTPSQANLSDPVLIQQVNTFVTSVFEHLFDRAPLTTGLNYWTDQVLTGAVSVSNAILDIANGATGNDLTLLQNKIAAASEFTLTTAAANIGLTASTTTSGLIAEAHQVLTLVTVDPASVTGPVLTAINSYIANNQNATTFTLTTAVASPNGYTNVDGDLTPYLYNGVGPTLVSGDSISNVTNLNITDQYGAGNDVIPSGVTLSNIANINLTTQSEAGGGLTTSGAYFDVSGVSGLTAVNVTSYGGLATDNVKAASTTAITVTQSNTGVAAGVRTEGGSTVTVADSGSGAGVHIGSTTVPAANPTGVVVVNEYGTNAVNVYGGSAAAGSTAVTVNTAGTGAVTIGDSAIDTESPASNVTSGNIVVTDTDTLDGVPAGAIGVFGGQEVTVTSTPQLGGAITVGTLASGGGNTHLSFNAATNQQFVASGNVTVTNEAAIANEYNYQTQQTSGDLGGTTVVGGADIAVTTDTGGVVVGAQGFGFVGNLFSGTTEVLGPTGAPLVSGTVSVIDTSNNIAGGVGVFGGVGTASTPAVTIDNAGTFVQVGAEVHSGGALEVAAPTGAVVVDNGTSTAAPNQAFDNIANPNSEWVEVFGATVTNVTVDTNAGGVLIGDPANAPNANVAEPTGTILVTDAAGAVNPNSSTIDGAGNPTQDAVDVFGASGAGSTVTVQASDGDVVVGTAGALPNTDPSGAVSVTVAAIETGSAPDNTIAVYGGNGITISATGAHSITAGSAAAPVAGAVSITDSFNGTNLENTNGDAITVVGGVGVTITESASSGPIQVGGPTVAALNAAGTGLADAGDYASGAVAITNASGSGAAAVFGTGSVTANVYGSSSVSVVGGSSVDITDEATTLATSGAGAGKPIGPSTLATVVLDGVTGGGAAVTTNSATLGLSVFDNAASQTYAVDEASAYALTVTLGNETNALTIDDANNNATSITVGDSTTLVGNAAASVTTGSTPGIVTLESSSAKSLTFNNTGAQSFVLDTAAVTAVTATGSGALTLASINPGATSFNGASGSGNQTVGLTQNALGAGVTLVGGTGSNTLVVNYDAALADVALGTSNSVKGFGTLAIGDVESATTHAAYAGPVAARAQVDTVTITAAGVAGDTYSVELNGNPVVTYTDTAGTATAATIAGALAGDLFAQATSGYTINYTALSDSFTVTGPVTAGVFTPFTVTTGGTAPAADVAELTAAGQDSGLGDAYYDASGFKALTVGDTTGDVTFKNVGSGVGLTITASQGATSDVVNYLLASGSTLPLTVGVDGAAGVGTAGITTTVLTTGVTSISVASLGEVKDAYGNTQTNLVTIGDTAATAVTITGDQALKLTLHTDANGALTEAAGAGNSAVFSINAFGSTGAVNVDGVALAYDATHTIVGGSGVLTAEGGTYQKDIDSITTGSGGGVITIGSGGAWNTAVATIVSPLITVDGAFDVGSESINLSAATAKSSTIVVNEGAVANAEGGIGAGGVTGFKAVASAAADQLSFANIKTVLANVSTITVVGNVVNHAGASTVGDIANSLDPSGKLASDIVNLTYTSSNGVISFGATGGHTLSSFTTSELIAAAEIITAAAHTNEVASFVAGGSTFIVASGNTDLLANDVGSVNLAVNGNDSSIVQLIGQTTDTGFAAETINAPQETIAGIGASGAIIANVSAEHADGGYLGPAGSTINGSTWVSGAAGGAAVVYNDSGYSIDYLESTNSASATGTTTFTNLAPAAELGFFNAPTVGNVVVTQTGTAAASDSLYIEFASSSAVASITTSNDWTLTIDTGFTSSIGSLVDSTGTVGSINITDANALGAALTIGSLTASALTNINAGADTGSLTLGSAAALTETGLTIVGARGGDAIFANGTDTTITIGDATGTHAVTGAVTISASGAGDIISVTDSTGPGSTILAGGAGDTISVDTGINSIGSGTVALGVTGGLGATDTVNLADGGADFVWLGANSLVNLAKDTLNGHVFGTDVSNATVKVTNDLTGVTSSGVVAGTATAHGTGLETINGAATIGANGSLTINIDNVNVSGGTLTQAWAGGSEAGALVNVQSATSLANALDIAAAQSVIYDAQHGAANTSVVGGVAELNGSTGLLDWFQYGGNTFIVEAINNTSTLGHNGAAAHTALTISDAVVELTGLVNLGTTTHVHIA